MINIHPFIFNPFEENTYVLFDETKECIIIDPGCYEKQEKQELAGFIEENELKPVKLLNTHCHIDHVFGNRFIAKRYDLDLEINKLELPVLQSVASVAQLYGIPNLENPPDPVNFLNQGDIVEFGNSKLDVLLIPGHSPGHIVLVGYNAPRRNDPSLQMSREPSGLEEDRPLENIATSASSEREQKFVITGDVLFYGSIGRTDLPGGDHNTLIESIKTKLFALGDDFQVYTGHGPVTNIGFERKNNPFLQ